MEHENIYDDIPEFDLGKELDKLEAKNKELEDHVKSLEYQIEKLNSALVEMKKVQENLKTNISELYKTAKREIDWKDKVIQDLREQIDNFVFRKNSYHDTNIRKRTREQDDKLLHDKRPKYDKNSGNDSKRRNESDHKFVKDDYHRRRDNSYNRYEGSRTKDERYDKHRNFTDRRSPNYNDNRRTEQNQRSGSNSKSTDNTKNGVECRTKITSDSIEKLDSTHSEKKPVRNLNDYTIPKKIRDNTDSIVQKRIHSNVVINKTVKKKKEDVVSISDDETLFQEWPEDITNKKTKESDKDKMSILTKKEHCMKPASLTHIEEGNAKNLTDNEVLIVSDNKISKKQKNKNSTSSKIPEEQTKCNQTSAILNIDMEKNKNDKIFKLPNTMEKQTKDPVVLLQKKIESEVQLSKADDAKQISNNQTNYDSGKADNKIIKNHKDKNVISSKKSEEKTEQPENFKELIETKKVEIEKTKNEKVPETSGIIKKKQTNGTMEMEIEKHEPKPNASNIVKESTEVKQDEKMVVTDCKKSEIKEKVKKEDTNKEKYKRRTERKETSTKDDKPKHESKRHKSAEKKQLKTSSKKKEMSVTNKNVETPIDIKDVIPLTDIAVDLSEKINNSKADLAKQNDEGNDDNKEVLKTHEDTLETQTKPPVEKAAKTSEKKQAEEKPLNSFQNILSKSKKMDEEFPELHLTHDGEIPILHLEEDHFKNVPHDENLQDKNIFNLIDVMNITGSALECDIPKFKNSSDENMASETLNATKEHSNDAVSFENCLNKVTSTPNVSNLIEQQAATSETKDPLSKSNSLNSSENVSGLKKRRRRVVMSFADD